MSQRYRLDESVKNGLRLLWLPPPIDQLAATIVASLTQTLSAAGLAGEPVVKAQAWVGDLTPLVGCL